MPAPSHAMPIFLGALLACPQACFGELCLGFCRLGPGPGSTCLGLSRSKREVVVSGLDGLCDRDFLSCLRTPHVLVGPEVHGLKVLDGVQALHARHELRAVPAALCGIST